MNINGKTLFAGLLLMIGATGFNVSASDLVTEWRTFPSANWRMNPNPKKVIQYCPTERFVYVIMHGNHYTKQDRGLPGYDYGYYTIANPHLFVYDLQNPDNGFVPAQDIFPESNGLNVITIGYNDKKNYLVATYQNGRIEFLYDDGTVKRIEDFKDAKVPGSKEFNSVSFDNENGEIYVGTQNGYLVLDEETATLKEWIKLWSPVQYITRMGDTLLAVVDLEIPGTETEEEPAKVETTIVSYDLSNGSPSLLSQFKPLTITEPAGLISSKMFNDQTGHITASDGICPLTDKTFVTFGRKGGAGTNATSVISLTRLEDGTYRPLILADQTVTALNANFVYRSFNSDAFNRMKDGWCFKTYDFQLVKEGIDPDFTVADPTADYKAKIVSRVRPTGLGATHGATYDGQNFWSFLSCGVSDLNGGFQRYERTGETTAVLAESKILPKGPMGMMGRYISYAPGYGMIVPGREYTRAFMYSYDVVDMLMLFDGETWTPYGYPVIKPSYASYFVGARGTCVDPENPKYFYTGSYGSGMVRRNLEDAGDVLHITFGTNYNASRTTDVEIMPNYRTNTGHANAYMTRPSIDGEGRLWVAGFNSSTPYSNPLFYWEKEDRLATTGKNDYKPMKRMDVPVVGENKSELCALAHENNHNILVYSGGVYESNLCVINHKGTLEDTTDDVIVSVTKGFDEDARDIVWSYINFIEEDPNDGRVWIFTEEGLFWLDPAEFMQKPGLMHRLIVDSVNDVPLRTVICDNSMPLSYTVDSYGRTWFGLNGGGIIAISADKTSQIASFNTSNSELLSDIVFGLGWNPERNALMVSSDRGYQEMLVLEGNAGTSKGHKIYPSSVRPGYKGHINITAAVDSHIYVVTDSDGETLAVIGQPIGGKLQWDLKTSDGDRIKTGIYNIVDNTDEQIIGEVVVVE